MKETSKKYFDRKAKDRTFTPGQQVLVKKPGKAGKLELRGVFAKIVKQLDQHSVLVRFFGNVDRRVNVSRVSKLASVDNSRTCSQSKYEEATRRPSSESGSDSDDSSEYSVPARPQIRRSARISCAPSRYIA